MMQHAPRQPMEEIIQCVFLDLVFSLPIKFRKDELFLAVTDLEVFASDMDGSEADGEEEREPLEIEKGQ